MKSTDKNPPLSPRRQNAIIMLILAVAFIVGARFILSNPSSSETQHLSIPGIGDVNAPSCPSKMITGVPCPVCGITRSIAYISRGRIIDGFQFHPLGPLFAALVIISIPISIRILIIPDPGKPDDSKKEKPSTGRIYTTITIILILISWLISLLRHYDIIGW